jgi:ubiquinone/menaquinone biosynthesis C-methylase UbiE
MRWTEALAYSISKRSRERKFASFLRLMAPKRHETVIDVGVNDAEYSPTDNYLEKHYPFPEKVTAVSEESLDEFSRRYPDIRAVVSDGRSLPFPDDAFDIGYSNAVIEHVGGREAQEQFLKELYRVSRRGYLTTPNRRFPVEVHTRIPLLHLLLSKERFDDLLKRIGKGWAAGGYMHLLSFSDLVQLLQETGIKEYSIRRNRFFGFTMTFTVTWKK